MPLSDVLSSFLCSNTYSKIITLRSENIAMIMYTWISSFQYKNIIMQELHIVPVDIQHLTWWVAEIDFVFIAWKRNQAMPFGSKYALVLARTRAIWIGEPHSHWTQQDYTTPTNHYSIMKRLKIQHNYIKIYCPIDSPCT